MNTYFFRLITLTTEFRTIISTITLILAVNCSSVFALLPINTPPKINISCANEILNTTNISPFFAIPNKQVICVADTYDAENNPVAVTWDFGDNSGIAENAVHSYKITDTYTITAFASDGTNITTSSLEFRAVGDENIDLNCTTDFMTVTCEPVVLQDLDISSAVIDWGDGTATRFGLPETSGSSSSASSSSSGKPVKAWNFDTQISHTYIDIGDYDINLSYTSGGQLGRENKQLHISGEENNEPRVTISCDNQPYNIEHFDPFYYTPHYASMCTVDTENFDKSTLVTLWDFGNGYERGGRYVYQNSSYYVVKARVSDGQHEVSRSMNFRAQGYDNTNLNCSTHNMTVSCIPISYNYSGSIYSRISWGDGTFSEFGNKSSTSSTSSTSSISPGFNDSLQRNQRVSHTYSEKGIYDIVHYYEHFYIHNSESTVVDINGIDANVIDASIECRNVYATSNIDPVYSAKLHTEYVICEPNIVAANIKDLDIQWDAGDDTGLVTSDKFSHAYTMSGTYTVTATISNEFTTAEFQTTISTEANSELPTVLLSCDAMQSRARCSINAWDSESENLFAVIGWGDGTIEFIHDTESEVFHDYATNEKIDKEVFVTVFDEATASTATSTVSLNNKELSDIECNFEIISDWPGHFLAQLTLTNTGNDTLNDWSVKLLYPDSTEIIQYWGTEISGTNPYSLTPLNWNKILLPAQAISIGFIGAASNTNAFIPNFDGTTCSQ